MVLAASLLLAVAQPLTSGLFDEQGSFNVFFSLLIIAVLMLVFEAGNTEESHVDRSGRLSGHLGGLRLRRAAGRVLLVATHLLAACFLAFALYGILRAIFVKHASGDAIFGAVCGYLLLGIIWSLLYSAVETASPGSFDMPVVAETPMPWLHDRTAAL